MTRMAVLALAVGLVGCAAASAPRGRTPSSVDPSWAGRPLTPEGSDSYRLSGSATISAAASNSGGNTRTVWWDDSQTARADEQSCATWVSQTNGLNQQGAALRITDNRAITVTKNVWAYAPWRFNVHLWETSTGLGTLLASFDLRVVFLSGGNNGLALPWDLCARVTGSTLAFIAWVHGQPRPAWSDTSHGGTVTLPTGWVYVGSAGFYTGHLQPGDDVVFSNLSAGRIPERSDAQRTG